MNSTSTRYDIVIAHRVSPGIAKLAVGFDNKLDMVRETTRSLLAALVGIKAKIILILDGCPPDYDSIIPTAEESPDIEIIRTNAIGNQATFALQIDRLCSVTCAKFVYFSEDDYLYRSNAFKTMMDTMSCANIDFITPLDHPDYYRSDAVAIPSRLQFFEGHHWRSSTSTCLTFMTKPDTLRRTRGFFLQFSNGCLDNVLWMGLTGYLTYNPLLLIWTLIRYALHMPTNRHALYSLAGLKYLNLRLIPRKQFSLYSPIPTLATHLSGASLPPGASTFFTDATQRAEIHKIESEYLSA